jgi:hypothetical protein
MSGPPEPIPRAVLTYGLLGLIPFLAPPVAGMLWPELKPLATTLLTFYGALILSFLGGARWGLAVSGNAPSAIDVTLAMIPTLAGLGLLLFPDPTRQTQLFGLAGALALHWLWDIRGTGLPVWYGRLRTTLTAGAVLGLVSGALILVPR